MNVCYEKLFNFSFVALGKIVNAFVYLRIAYRELCKGNGENSEEQEIIEVLETSHNVDVENVIKYLKNNILKTEDNFKESFFREPLVVKFRHLKSVYTIALNALKSTNKDHHTILSTPSFLSAQATIDNCEKCVTNEVNEIHGPDKNYFGHIPDTISEPGQLMKICPVLKKSSRVLTMNILGEESVHFPEK